MRLKNKLSLLLMAALCTMSFKFAHAQETPPDTDTPVDSPTDDTPTVDKDKVKKKLKADFFLDFDWGEEVINMTPNPANSEFYEAASDSLVLGDYSKGFRVVKYSEISRLLMLSPPRSNEHHNSKVTAK